MITKKMHLALVLLLVLALTLSGCGVSQKEYEDLQAQLTSVQAQLTSVQAQLTSVQEEYEAAKSASQNEIEELQAELTSQSAMLDQTQSSNDALQKTVSELENELNATLDTEVVQYYVFSDQVRYYTWAPSIPLRTYFYYRDKPRLTESSKYSAMATDSYADSIINILVGKVQEATRSYDLRNMDIINLVAAFTQTMPHTNKAVGTPYDEYPRYPVETLFEQGGDSEDTSILAAALLTRLGYNVVFFVFEQEKHVALGVDIDATGCNWEYQAKRYYYLETTGEKWQLGGCLSIYREAQPLILPISK